MCQLYRKAVAEAKCSWKAVPDFTIEQLEIAIIADSENSDPLLQQLHIRLLRGLNNTSDIE